jgi:hypothetical protein
MSQPSESKWHTGVQKSYSFVVGCDLLHPFRSELPWWHHARALTAFKSLSTSLKFLHPSFRGTSLVAPPSAPRARRVEKRHNLVAYDLCAFFEYVDRRRWLSEMSISHVKLAKGIYNACNRAGEYATDISVVTPRHCKKDYFSGFLIESWRGHCDIWKVAGIEPGCQSYFGRGWNFGNHTEIQTFLYVRRDCCLWGTG